MEFSDTTHKPRNTPGNPRNYRELKCCESCISGPLRPYGECFKYHHKTEPYGYCDGYE